MKLIISYRIAGSKYNVTISGDEPKIYEELNKALLDAICNKFGDLVSEYSISKVVEEVPIGKLITLIVVNITLHSSDIRFSENEKTDFVAKTVIGTIAGLSVDRIMDSVVIREEKIVEVKNPCERGEKKEEIFSLIKEWNNNFRYVISS
ncbi:VapB-like antitoxin [Sulfurisphaera ohwakuensis]|uniref:VapB-like antitoxin n=1 Tax=Sulfurisphaera ohwakuensis TaxID=69656 RepID=A0A650CII8_SULOH|nr:VapB-like antitoxin [Sulfurisphaera ohwakuensis]MBB5255223.1 hypothetical protein [Sulfurisphaera ohwakuensis]QGR17622.1 VapB-like antitoxin [Sulfurisphaera ohwakuensis]